MATDYIDAGLRAVDRVRGWWIARRVRRLPVLIAEAEDRMWQAEQNATAFGRRLDDAIARSDSRATKKARKVWWHYTAEVVRWRHEVRALKVELEEMERAR